MIMFGMLIYYLGVYYRFIQIKSTGAVVLKSFYDIFGTFKLHEIINSLHHLNNYIKIYPFLHKNSYILAFFGIFSGFTIIMVGSILFLADLLFILVVVWINHSFSKYLENIF